MSGGSRVRYGRLGSESAPRGVGVGVGVGAISVHGELQGDGIVSIVTKLGQYRVLLPNPTDSTLQQPN